MKKLLTAIIIAATFIATPLAANAYSDIVNGIRVSTALPNRPGMAGSGYNVYGQLVFRVYNNTNGYINCNVILGNASTNTGSMAPNEFTDIVLVSSGRVDWGCVFN